MRKKKAKKKVKKKVAKKVKRKQLPEPVGVKVPNERKKVMLELSKLVPFPSPSISYLAEAIVQKARVFLTSDPVVFQLKDTLEKQYNMFLTDDYNEAQEIIRLGRRPTALDLK